MTRIMPGSRYLLHRQLLLLFVIGIYSKPSFTDKDTENIIDNYRYPIMGI